jgi:hypothetical protein
METHLSADILSAVHAALWRDDFVHEAVIERADEILVWYFDGAAPMRNGPDKLRWPGNGGFELTLSGEYAGRWFHFATHKHGDGLDLIAERMGLDRNHAAVIRHAANILGIRDDLPPEAIEQMRAARERRLAQAEKLREQADAELVRRIGLAKNLLAGSVSGFGTPADAYLAGRGLTVPTSATPYFRYVERCHHGPLGRPFPAMVWPQIDITTGQTVGAHRTYLDPVTGAKLEAFDAQGEKINPKLMLGQSKITAIKVSGHDLGARLSIAEGVETALTAWAMTADEPGAVWALGSLRAFNDFVAPEGVRELRIYADPEPAAIDTARACAERHKALGLAVELIHTNDMDGAQALNWPGLVKLRDLNDVWAQATTREDIAGALIREHFKREEATRPLYDTSREVSLDRAEILLRSALRSAIDGAEAYNKVLADTPKGEVAPSAPHHVFTVTVGAGKSHGYTTEIVDAIRTGRFTRKIGIFVPTRIKAEEAQDSFQEHLERYEWSYVRTFKGRGDFVTGDDGPTMCGDLETVNPVQDAGVPVWGTCCETVTGPPGDQWREYCPLFDTCPYVQQVEAGREDFVKVWIAPHAQLGLAGKHYPKNVGLLVIDESFLTLADAQKKVWELGLDTCTGDGPAAPFFKALASVMMQGAGKVPRTGLLAALEAQGIAADAVEVELTVMLAFEAEIAKALSPPSVTGKSVEDRRAAMRGFDVKALRRAKSRVGALEEALFFLTRLTSPRSGRMKVEAGDGRLFLRVVQPGGIAQRFAHVPKVYVDATTPQQELVELFLPGAIFAPPINVKDGAGVTTMQILRSPSSGSKMKLGGKEPTGLDLKDREALNRADADGTPPPPASLARYAKQRNIGQIRRIMRWAKHGAGDQPVAVIAQKEPRAALSYGYGEGDGYLFGHFNAIRGMNSMKAARVLLVVGRPRPQVEAVEDLRGLITGEAPEPLLDEHGAPARFFRSREVTAMGIDGKLVPHFLPYHPDGLCDALLRTICQDEIVQAVGRARAVRRGADDPVLILILADEWMPIRVDGFVAWRDLWPGAWADMAGRGMIFGGATMAHKVYPDLFPTVDAAKQAISPKAGRGQPLARFDPDQAGIDGVHILVGSPVGNVPLQYPLPLGRPIRFRVAGAKGGKVSRAWFNPAVIPDPKAWLETRLGALSFFEVEGSYEPPAPEPAGEARPYRPWHDTPKVPPRRTLH